MKTLNSPNYIRRLAGAEVDAFGGEVDMIVADVAFDIGGDGREKIVDRDAEGCESFDRGFVISLCALYAVTPHIFRRRCRCEDDFFAVTAQRFMDAEQIFYVLVELCERSVA